MDITPMIGREQKIITAYGAGGFSLNQQRYDGSLLLAGSEAIAWNEMISAEELLPQLLQHGAELLLIGTGTNMLPVEDTFRAALKQHHISVDAMDTGAACRTYNVLVAEGRRVAAALVAI